MLKILLIMLGLSSTPTERGLSTIFGSPGDKFAGGATRCLRDESGKPRRVRPDDIGVAHRRLRCGSRVVVRSVRTGKVIITTVIDAGPYGAGRAGVDWYIKRRADTRPPGCPTCAPLPWRGIADLTPRAAALIDHNGLDRVELFYDKRNYRRRRR